MGGRNWGSFRQPAGERGKMSYGIIPAEPGMHDLIPLMKKVIGVE